MKYAKRANVSLGFCSFKFVQSDYIKEKLAALMEKVVLIVNDDSDKMPPLIFCDSKFSNSFYIHPVYLVRKEI